MKQQVSQKIMLAIKLGRIKIKIDKSWSLPFSLCMYQLHSFNLHVSKYYKCLEITLFKLNIVLFY